MNKLLLTLVLAFLSVPFASASIKKVDLENNKNKEELLGAYLKHYSSKKELAVLRKQTLDKSAKAVPALIEVMKSSKYPEKNRWVATFLLGQIMGEKSAPFISKFIKHPNWVMRMASLKTLMALKQKEFTGLYKKALTDNSLIVRTQALELVRKLQIKSMAPNVWSMLYDKRNYYEYTKKTKKSIGIVKNAVRTIGELKFEKALKPLFSMVQKPKYKDIFDDMDYALSKILGKKSPKGNINLKRRYWKRVALSHQSL